MRLFVSNQLHIPARISWGRWFHEPPQNTRRVQLPLLQVSVHCQTFPIMSYKPKALGLKLPTGAVLLLSHSLPHPSQFAWLRPMSLPQ